MVKKNTNKLNKFEETRLLATRALEIANGSKSNLKVNSDDLLLTKDYVKVAEEEYIKGKLDLEVYKK